MYNSDNFYFHDFIAFAVMAGIEKSFSEKKKAEKNTAEKYNCEKQCKCTENHCKNQQDFYKELLKKVCECKKEICDIEKDFSERLCKVVVYIINMENELRAEIQKADTENSCHTENHCPTTYSTSYKDGLIEDINKSLSALKSSGVFSTDTLNLLIYTLEKSKKYVKHT